MKTPLLASPLAAALLAACVSSSSSSGGGAGDGGGGSRGAGGTPSCGEYSACSLVSASTVGQAFGVTFSAGTENDVNKTPSASEAEEVQCTFVGTGGWNVMVIVRCCPCDDNEPQSIESEAQTLDETTSNVSGVGDTAFWAAPSGDAGVLSNAYTLYAFVGQSTMVSVNVTTASGATAPLPGAEQVAESVIERSKRRAHQSTSHGLRAQTACYAPRAMPRVVSVLALVAIACGTTPSPSPPSAPTSPISVEAGFVEVPPRTVTLKGEPVSIEATGRLFYNLQPALEDPADKPIFILSNGFAAEVVRAFGTGPFTVADGGAVVANTTPYTAFANLVYLEPRQSGYSYDVITSRAPGAADCAPAIFNEYVDAADYLLAALAFLETHPQLHGPVYWVGESYAGVRLTWLLAYLRGRWDLAPYADPTLAAKIAGTTRATSVMAGQIFLEGWLAGGAHTTAIAAACTDPVILAGISASVGTTCSDACACATANDRSLYNYTYTSAHETARETQASEAHIDPASAAMLLGVPLTSIPLLASAERSQGFRCSPPDGTLPPQDALVAALGSLPSGQAYYANYSPLYPGKETGTPEDDWRTVNLEGLAFVDNLRDVPTFLTAGAPRSRRPHARARAGARSHPRREPGGRQLVVPSRRDLSRRCRALRRPLRVPERGPHGRDDRADRALEGPGDVGGNALGTGAHCRPLAGYERADA